MREHSEIKRLSYLKSGLIFLLVSAIMILEGWSISQVSYIPVPILIAMIGFLVLVRWPGIAMTVIYPLAWVFWTYQIPGFGGIERAIAYIGIIGIFAGLQHFGTSYRLPSIWIGIGVFMSVLGYLIAWALNPGGSASELISLILHLGFLYLAYFHIRTRSQLNLAGWLFIVSSLFACTITLIANITLGLGFYRLFGGDQALIQRFGVLSNPALASTFVGAPAVLFFTTYKKMQGKFKQILIPLVSLYMFWMAFISQYRRELLITILLVLLTLVIDRRAGLRRPAWILLITSALVFGALLLPSSSVLLQRLNNETSSVVQGSETRIVNFRAGMIAFLQNPLGYGPGMYESVAYNILGQGYYSWEYHSYNVFIAVAVDGGVIALAGIIILFVSIFIQSLQENGQPNSPESWILRSSPAILLVVFIWFTFGNAVDVGLPWYLMGLILSAVRLAKETSQSI